MLRSRRPVDQLGNEEPSLIGLSEEVADRADLRAMLTDLAALPTDQREALVLAELHDNSHAQVAEILGCGHNKVKSLVFQARTSLMTSRQARELQCEEVQSQLSVLRGGSLRRAVLRRHLAECDACRLFGAEVKRQRAALAVVLPVIPTGTLKLGAAGALAASTAGAGAATAASTGTASTAGAGAGLAAKLGVPATLLKSAAATLAVTTAAAGGVATTAQVAHVTGKPPAPITQQAQQTAPPAQATPAPANAAQPPPAAPGAAGRQPGVPPAGKRSDQPLAGGQLPPGVRKQPKGVSHPPLADPRKPGPHPPKQEPAEPVHPIQGERPARPVPTRKPGDGPVRERPRPRPGPTVPREPIRPTEPAPPTGDGSLPAR